MVVPKADGRVRIRVDLTKLNQAVLRDIYHKQTVEENIGKPYRGMGILQARCLLRVLPDSPQPKSAKLTTRILRLVRVDKAPSLKLS